MRSLDVIRLLGRADYSTANRIATSIQRGRTEPDHPAAPLAISGRFGDRFGEQVALSLPGSGAGNKHSARLSTANVCGFLTAGVVYRILATACPNSRLNRDRQWLRNTNQKRMGMTKQPDNAAAEREEITARIARFKATQEKFKREREEYFITTMGNASQSRGRPSL
jgi:hypothetical protein